MMVLELLSAAVPAYAAATERDRLNEELRGRRILHDEPVDFSSLRAIADAMAAKQSSSFKVYEIGTELEFPGGGIRIKAAEFNYFQPLHRDGRWTWEKLGVHVTTPVTAAGGKSQGSITGERRKFEDAVPTAAPSNIIAPEKAIALLNRGPMNSPKPQEPSKDRSRWTLTVQLIQIGAKYWAGNPTLFPTASLNTGEKGTYLEEPFFVKTAPRGKWVWWTVAQHVVAGGRYKYIYEYIYMDAVSGRATSHCAEQPSSYKPLSPVACQPPR